MVLLPHDDPDRALGMRDTHELARQLRRVDVLERKAKDKTVASVLRTQRQLQRHDIELTAEVLEGSVVFRNASDTKGRKACFRAQFGDDLFDHAQTARHRHAASLRTLNERYESC